MDAAEREYYDLCGKHLPEKQAEDWRLKLAGWFEKAQKIPAAEFSEECLLSDGDDRYFADLDEAEAWYAEEESERPQYLWLTKEVCFAPDFEGGLRGQMAGDLYEGASEDIPDAAWEELRAFEKRWWAENGVKGWAPDYTRCVLLPAAGSETKGGA